MNRIATCPYGIHEALHMAHVALCIFDDHVAQHPAVAERPELSTIADRVSAAMGELYQAIGQLDG